MYHLSFYKWMTLNHLQDASSMGKLARDMKEDKKHFIRATKHSRNRAYLELCDASENCLDTFEEAWKGYTAYKRASQRHA